MGEPGHQTRAKPGRPEVEHRAASAQPHILAGTPTALARDVRRKAHHASMELARSDYPWLERITISVCRSWVRRTQFRDVAGWPVASIQSGKNNGTKTSTVWLLSDGQLAVQTGHVPDSIRRVHARDEALRPHLQRVSAGLDQLIRRLEG